MGIVNPAFDGWSDKEIIDYNKGQRELASRGGYTGHIDIEGLGRYIFSTNAGIDEISDDKQGNVKYTFNNLSGEAEVELYKNTYVGPAYGGREGDVGLYKKPKPKEFGSSAPSF